ncbi:hypothetical protein DYB32_003979 [Aphanomyces invadans]|uniref:Aspartyl/asparaginy/proline hydroxylase domain-containing protein n=1 Tax=Aphanomyces invadans TaxID=157072 RepID=A0A3R6VYP1_9STRA|nr:hypothetical protein DYB32_003979 [Aphanomyces invadans]
MWADQWILKHGVPRRRDKRRPSEVLVAEDPSIELVCATTRSTSVDVSKLQAALLSLPEDRWSEEYQTKHNVSLRRPFHDKVGVNKIICIFSDNHLEHVYMLPEWTHWQPLVAPIFEHLQIPLDRVVRCLFARMPPKTLIPPHHDNGPWVARTHRIHVPLVTYPEVEFKSGRDEASMERYAFNVGTVVELNNAAKHSVYNGASDWRIHMIFDVLADPSEAVDGAASTAPIVSTLQAGQLCRQVRGRVELVTELDQTSTEAATKVAGELLVQLKKRLSRETFDPLTMLLADSTPSYLLYGSPVAQRMRQLLPSTRFIVVLRNPIQRAYSQYHMTADPHGTPHQLAMRKAVQGKSFQDVVDEDLRRLQGVQAAPTSLEAFQAYADALPQDHGSHSYLGRGLYALQLRIWFQHFPRDQFLVLNVDAMDTPEATQTTLHHVCQFLRLPPFTLQDSARQNTRAYAPMDDAIRDSLRAFYAPYNAMLHDLLPDFAFSWS